MLRFCCSKVQCMNQFSYVCAVKNINTYCVLLTSDKDCGEKYISEIINNFKKFSHNPRKKHKPIQNDNLSKYKKIFSYSKDFEKSEIILNPLKSVKKQKISSKGAEKRGISSKDAEKRGISSKDAEKKGISSKDAEKQGINIDNSVQEAIDALFRQKQFEDARDSILYNIKHNHIPNFKSLRIISSLAAQKGDTSTIRIVQNTAKINYSLLYKNENCFDHYLCEALCREGNYKETFTLLSSLIENSTKFKRVKESASFIMMMVPTIPEEYQDEILKIASKFLQKDVLRPVIVLWKESFISDQYHLQYVANKLLEENANLLDEEEVCISGMIELAASQNDAELLHRLMELILRLKNRELLQKVVSALLNLHCMMENLPKANQLLKFSTEEGLHISSEIGQKYLDLLNGHRKQSTLSVFSRKDDGDKSIIKFKF